MRIGGELENLKPLLSPAQKKQSTQCSAPARGVYIGGTTGPGSWHEPGLNGSIWSRFMARTGTIGGGPGARHIGPGSSHQPGPKGPDEPGPMAHVARPAPWAHEPGPMPPLVPVLD